MNMNSFFNKHWDELPYPSWIPVNQADDICYFLSSIFTFGGVTAPNIKAEIIEKMWIRFIKQAGWNEELIQVKFRSRAATLLNTYQDSDKRDHHSIKYLNLDFPEECQISSLQLFENHSFRSLLFQTDKLKQLYDKIPIEEHKQLQIAALFVP